MILGIDCAAVDENVYVDWVRAKADGPIRFALVRGTYGDTPDAAFRREWPALAAADLTRGAYLFLRFPRKTGAQPAGPCDQAHAFVKVVGPLERHDFPPTIDVMRSART